MIGLVVEKVHSWSVVKDMVQSDELPPKLPPDYSYLENVHCTPVTTNVTTDLPQTLPQTYPSHRRSRQPQELWLKTQVYPHTTVSFSQKIKHLLSLQTLPKLRIQVLE